MSTLSRKQVESLAKTLCRDDQKKWKKLSVPEQIIFRSQAVDILNMVDKAMREEKIIE